MQTIQIPPRARARADARADARARARGAFCIVHIRKVDISVGILKEQQKFQIQFLELHGGFSIVDNTDLRTRARARASPRARARGEFCIVHNGKVDMLFQKTEFEISLNP